MATLPFYKTFDEKNKLFKKSAYHQKNKIDTIKKFDDWYNGFWNAKQADNNWEKYFFRGMGEARHKLYTSAQRKWITAEVESWKTNARYEDFLQNLVDKAKNDPLFERVFSFYKLRDGEYDFPLLSIIQHYGGPTPLMDWTYDLDVALFFATELIAVASASDEIENYFSVYVIDNDVSKIQSISQFKSRTYPPLKHIFEHEKRAVNELAKLFYLSDYNRDKKEPLTSIYNQNIIPQRGVFIFNPSATKPFEDYFNETSAAVPFRCYNIRKDLGEYIRRKIASKGIVKSLIYPDLRNNITSIHESVLNSYF